MTTEKDKLIIDQRNLINDYKDLITTMDDRNKKLGEYLATALKAMQSDNPNAQAIGIEHINNVIASLKKEKQNAQA